MLSKLEQGDQNSQDAQQILVSSPGSRVLQSIARSGGPLEYDFAPFTEIFNVTSQPAANLPLFQSASGMPIGVQMVDRLDQDHAVLRLAADLEQATGWTRRHPPIWAG